MVYQYCYRGIWQEERLGRYEYCYWEEGKVQQEGERETVEIGILVLEERKRDGKEVMERLIR